jgi:hypothetical protein
MTNRIQVLLIGIVVRTLIGLVMLGFIGANLLKADERSGGLVNELEPVIAAGLRDGGTDSGNKIGLAYLGLKLNHTEIKMGENKLSLLAPGVNIQTDGKTSVSISPIAVMVKDKYAINFDIFPKSQENAGAIGLSFGIPIR